ncbi:metallophosphoesterase [Marisediminicola sp. LYQ134]|uniref:metallophosphoesterase n=1 Tax=Marisediminicola sp. LYQ134 TaxID=3391061 RepID=UPI0039832539
MHFDSPTDARPRSHRLRSLQRRTVATLGAAATLLSLAAHPALPAAAAAPESVAEGDSARFTLAVLPDTQFYSRYANDQFAPRYGTNPFAVQTEWLAAHRDDLNIPFVAHLGDVVDRVNTASEWMAADAAMSSLEAADLPYSVLAGNHDVRNSSDDWFDTDYTLDEEPYLEWFGTDRAEGQSTYGGSDPTGFNQYHVFEAAGEEFLVLALSWRSSDATLDWANEVIAENPTLPVILTTHSLLNIEADAVTPKEEEYGLRLWDQLIRDNDQIFLTFNGHFHGSTQLTKTNAYGHPVTEVLMDYQMAYDGGNGYLGLLEFDLTNNLMTMQTASPWVTWKPEESLTSYDQPFLEQPNQQYTIDIDFAERFAGFAPDWAAGAADQPSLVQKARDILLDGFDGPDPIALEQPGSRDDFVAAEGTVAHWRFGDEPGVVAEGQVFEDIAGDADLTRVSLEDSGSTTAQLDDVTVTDDANPFSADGGGVCFTDSDQRDSRFSYLTSPADVPATTNTLENGYTIETFLKMDESWSAEANGWSKAIVRSGNRSELPGMPWSQWDYTASPAALGISNLREFQWTEVPTETTKGDRTAWSGEIMVDRWIHVAIVGDPDTSTSTMYVDGAPVLRNATDTLGQSINSGSPWIFGADWVDDSARNGWNGCIGETRVIDHATGPDEWLTARPDLSGLTTTAPSGTLPVGTEVDSIDGSGYPGATVSLTGDLEGTTAVDDDGSWTIPLAATVSDPDRYSFAVQQGFGTRLSGLIDGAFRIAAAATPGTPGDPDEGTPGDGSGGGTGGGTGDAGDDTDTAADGRPDGDLAFTGSTIGSGLIIGAIVLFVLGAVAVMAARVRRGRSSV